MEVYILRKESLLQKYPKPIGIEGTTKILEQMKYCICKLNGNDGSKGTGFFCIIPFQKEDSKYTTNIPFLITNQHVLSEEYIKEKKEIYLTLNDDNIDKEIRITKQDKRLIYSNEEYDITMIEIIKDDKINHFLELDERLLTINSNKFYEKKSVYTLQYPGGDKASVSYGVIHNIDKHTLYNKCSTTNGSSGGPILNLNTNKVIGIHKEGSENFEFNLGTILNYPIRDFTNVKKANEIKMKVKIEKEDLNKEIFFLENTEDDHTFKNNHNKYLKELNNTNAELFINDIPHEFKKSFIPRREGIYSIDLQLKTPITDCSFLFAKCSKTIEIDLSSLDTSNVTDMRYMFYSCEKLSKINLFYLNTSNVTDMNRMFYNCSCLENIDLSFFETPKLTNLKYMFCNCEKLPYLNLQSFDTKNVNKMSNMFSNCRNLKVINLSSFEIGDITNLDNIFFNCVSLKEIIINKKAYDKIKPCVNGKNINIFLG